MANIIAVFHTEDVSVEFYDDFTFKQKSVDPFFNGITGQWKIEEDKLRYSTSNNRSVWKDSHFTLSDFTKLCAEYEFDRQLAELLGE
jgi:hypothetical protein